MEPTVDDRYSCLCWFFAKVNEQRFAPMERD